MRESAIVSRYCDEIAVHKPIIGVDRDIYACPDQSLDAITEKFMATEEDKTANGN